MVQGYNGYDKMKIKELLEAEVKPYTKEEIAKEKAISILEKSIFFENNKSRPLWRGTRSNLAEVILIDPSDGIRKSENTDNYYTLLMDNSPYYQGWPKRSKSLICTTNPFTATYYEGRIYALIPLNGSKIGVCPEEDIWKTSVEILNSESLVTFGQISLMMYNLGFSDKSYQSLLHWSTTNKFIRRLDERFPEHNLGNKNFIEYMHEQMSPEKTGMKLETAESMDVTNYPDNECWTDGKCLLVRKDIYKQLFGVTFSS